MNRSRADLRVVAVEDLPWPHQQFKCAFAEEVKATVPAGVEFEARHNYVAAFVRALRPERLRECPFHTTNWGAAAEAAIRVWQGALPDLDAAAEKLLAAGEPGETVEAMCSFFWEPIFINGPRLGNGQHRVCAMKLARVPRCLIED